MWQVWMLTTKMFSIVSILTKKKKVGCWNFRIFVHSIFQYPIQYLLRKSNLIMNIGAKDKFFEEKEKNDNVGPWDCDSEWLDSIY